MTARRFYAWLREQAECDESFVGAVGCHMDGAPEIAWAVIQIERVPGGPNITATDIEESGEAPADRLVALGAIRACTYARKTAIESGARVL